MLFVLYENPVTHEKLEVKIPLEYFIDLEKARQEIGLPSYVDLDTFQMKKIGAILWVSKNLDEVLPDIGVRSLDIAVFGGAAFKLTCPSTNGKGPFARTIGDVDLVTSREHGKATVELLCRMHEKCGSAFFHGTTSDDRRFNKLREGKRFRLRTIKHVNADGTPVMGFTDVFCQDLTFCHKLSVREEVRESPRHHCTIGLEKMIISKAQYVRTVHEAELGQIDKARILSRFDGKNYLLGMETKDMLDVAAALLDHEVGSGAERIDDGKMAGILGTDWKLHKTVFMNLENMRRNLRSLVGGKVGEAELSAMSERLDQILQSITIEEKGFGRFFRFGKQWWEDVEDQVLAGTALN